jgi:hypothetical protein
MNRSRSVVASLAIGAALLLPTAAFAGTPAGGWTAERIDTQSPDFCNPIHGANRCDRPGGLVTKGLQALMLTADEGRIVAHRSTDGGDTWGTGQPVGPQQAYLPAIADDGIAVLYAYYTSETHRVRWDFQTTHGIPAAATYTLNVPRQVVTGVDVDVKQGMLAVATSAYDEAAQDRKGNAIRVRTLVDGIGAPDNTTTFAWGGVGCVPRGTDMQVLAVSTQRVIVAYWQTCDKLVIRRTTNAGETWSAPLTLSTGDHGQGMALDSAGSTVVIAYTANGTTWTRRSTDSGKTWGAPRAAGSGASSLRLTHADGAWHLLAAGKTSVRYRSSADGRTWSSGETVDSLTNARTFALGVDVTDGLVAAYAIRESASAVGLNVATR